MGGILFAKFERPVVVPVGVTDDEAAQDEKDPHASNAWKVVFEAEPFQAGQHL